MLASAENIEKKLISYPFFRKHRGLFIIEKKVWGVGFYFLLPSAQKGEEKKNSPAGGFPDNPLYFTNEKRFEIVYYTEIIFSCEWVACCFRKKKTR